MNIKAKIGAYLLEQELCVYIPKDKINAYDIRVYNKSGRKVYFLKVKAIDYEWTNQNDFPFEDVIIESVERWERKHGKIKILSHIFISKPTGAMLVLFY